MLPSNQNMLIAKLECTSRITKPRGVKYSLVYKKVGKHVWDDGHVQEKILSYHIYIYIYHLSNINYVLKNGHPEDVCYNAIGFRAQIVDIILDPNFNIIGRICEMI